MLRVSNSTRHTVNVDDGDDNDGDAMIDLWVNLARPSYPDIWSNTSLEVAVKVFLEKNNT